MLVEKDAKGLTFGKREPLMGFRGIETADMFFDNVEIPIGNMIVPGGSFRHLMEAFDLERCGNTTMSVGIAAGPLRCACLRSGAQAIRKADHRIQAYN